MLSNLVGKTIYLRSVEISDAEFILDLRTNITYNKYLSATNSSIEEQKKWLTNYKIREESSTEFYFIICRKDNDESIGTVRLYDFIKEEKSFCWGSWILNSSKTTSAALESALLVYIFAFRVLGFIQSHFDVRKENDKVIAFHTKMGAEIVSSNNEDFFFKYSNDKFEEKMKNFKRFLE